MLHHLLENVRSQAPLVHCITNYVTVNDCANILLACGASPIMADDPEEAADITAICNALVVNIGTLNQHTIPSMSLAGKKANELGHPVVLDPVGAGASPLRTNTAHALLDSVRFSVIRGNISEIKALALGNTAAKGVDADAADAVDAGNLDTVVAFAREFARKSGAVIAITGAIDIIADAGQVCLIRNGHPMMSKITGTGCMLSALTAAYVAANPENVFHAAVAAVCAMGLCGERAHARLSGFDGNATYRNYIIDEIFRLSGSILEAGANYEIR